MTMQSEALAVLLTRQSVGARHLVEPGPDDAALRLMCEAALRAPDHGALVPFRFVVVRGAARAQRAMPMRASTPSAPSAHR